MWNPNVTKLGEYPVDLAVEGHDRPGLLVDIMNTLSANDAKVNKIQAKYNPSLNTSTISMTILVSEKEQLSHFLHALTNVKGVFAIKRVHH